MDVSPTRCLAVWLGVTGATATLARWALDGVEPTSWVRPLGSFEALVPALAGVALTICAVWGWSVTTYVVVQALRHRAPAHAAGSDVAPVVPAWARRLVLAACGAALVGGALVGPAQATPGHIDVVSNQTDRDGGSGAAAVTGLPLPDRTTGPLRADHRTDSPDRTAGAVGEATDGGSITVRAGDSLWSIAARLLGPGATTVETADLVSHLHDTNRAEIGADPDLIFPGHQLRVPLGGHRYR